MIISLLQGILALEVGRFWIVQSIIDIRVRDACPGGAGGATAHSALFHGDRKGKNLPLQ